MKHMWKKNQIIITALAALVAVAGYLNYSGTKLGENALPASTTETEATLTDIDSLDQDITLTDSADGEVYLGEAAAGETDGMSGCVEPRQDGYDIFVIWVYHLSPDDGMN